MKGQTYIKKTNGLEFIVSDVKDGIVSYSEKHFMNCKQEPIINFLEKFEAKVNPKEDIIKLFNQVLENYKQDATSVITEHPCSDEELAIFNLNKEIEDYKQQLQDLLKKL